MNAQTIHGLGKTSRALSVFFVSLGVLIIAIPLSDILGTHTVPGVHAGDIRWPSWIHAALMFILIGAILFCCYLFARREKQSLLARGFMWSVILAAGAFGVWIVSEMLRVIIQH